MPDTDVARLQISAQVRQVLAGEGIAEPELEYMVFYAAMYSGPGGNRRYEDWLFDVTGNAVKSMRRLHMNHIGTDSGKLPKRVPCPACQGASCKQCGWIGELWQYK